MPNRPTLRRIAPLVLAVAAAALLLISCDRDDTPDFTLQLLHAADMDGATGALDNVEPFSAILDAFRDEYPDNTLVLSSGDNYVPGPRFFAAGDDFTDAILGVSGNGRGDIAMLNAMGFQATALGNHELESSRLSSAPRPATPAPIRERRSRTCPPTSTSLATRT